MQFILIGLAAALLFFTTALLTLGVNGIEARPWVIELAILFASGGVIMALLTSGSAMLRCKLCRNARQRGEADKPWCATSTC